MEAWIKQQEELRASEKKHDTFDDILAQRASELKQKMDRLKAGESQLRKREESLIPPRSAGTEQHKEDKKDRINQATMTDKENTKTSESNEKKPTYENTYIYPKITQFSGEEPKQKNEASYEEWKYEVNCLRKEGDHGDNVIAQAIRKSLRGQAKKVLLPLGTSAKLPDIMGKLEGVFGNVATGESVLREFYTASQNQEESVASWGLRLEDLLQKATDKGHIKQEDKNDMLREKFWRALRSDRLKNATRVHYESITNFELLRRAVRAEEHEMKISTGIKQQQMKVDTTKENEKVEDTKSDQILARLESLEKQMKYANKGRNRYQFKPRRSNYKTEETKQCEEKSKEDTTKKDF